jgi:hypothetical protein
MHIAQTCRSEEETPKDLLLNSKSKGTESPIIRPTTRLTNKFNHINLFVVDFRMLPYYGRMPFFV